MNSRSSRETEAAEPMSVEEKMREQAAENAARQAAGRRGTVRSLSRQLAAADRDCCSVKVDQRGDLFPDPVCSLVEHDRRSVAWRMYARWRDEEAHLEHHRERAYAKVCCQPKVKI